jgi:hypothetical protein
MVPQRAVVVQQGFVNFGQALKDGGVGGDDRTGSRVR